MVWQEHATLDLRENREVDGKWITYFARFSSRDNPVANLVGVLRGRLEVYGEPLDNTPPGETLKLSSVAPEGRGAYSIRVSVDESAEKREGRDNYCFQLRTLGKAIDCLLEPLKEVLLRQASRRESL